MSDNSSTPVIDPDETSSPSKSDSDSDHETTSTDHDSSSEDLEELTSDNSDNEEMLASDEEGTLTSEYSTEKSGSDDKSFSSASGAKSNSSESNNSETSLAGKKHQKKLIEKLISAGHRGPKIISILQEEHGIKMSTQTLTRKQKEWQLRLCNFQQPPPPAPLSANV
jgi:hypothetical protein